MGTQVRYAMVYVFITMIVLTILNIYSSNTSQQLFYQSKKTSMIEKCLIVSDEIAELDILNPSTASEVVERLGNLNVYRLIVTNQEGRAVYDSAETDNALGQYIIFPEIIEAMKLQDVFAWEYHNGNMQSYAATPIVSYGSLIGCVYIMEYDAGQGALIQSLADNILSVTLILEVAVLLFSFTYAIIYSTRLRRIMNSMRIIQEGDYSHKVTMGGHDELTVLGNEFNELTERLQTSERKRRQFVSDASHELKTPLASIKLLSDSILQNDMDTETVREFVEDIGNEADRLNRMTLKLLSLSRIEMQQDSDCEIVNIAPTVKQVIHMLSAIAKTNDITISFQPEDDYPILVFEDDLYQIIFNLIENAIKYNRPNGSITVHLTRDEDNVIFSVTDTGYGIPADAVPHVFERFFRVDKARSRQSGGSGLGLAIVKNMVERNQGTISVKSTLGIGSTFTVTFPIFDVEEDNEK